MDFAIADGKLFSCSCERGLSALIEPFSASKSNLSRRESLKLVYSRRGEALRSFYYSNIWIIYSSSLRLHAVISSTCLSPSLQKARNNFTSGAQSRTDFVKITSGALTSGARHNYSTNVFVKRFCIYLHLVDLRVLVSTSAQYRIH